MNFGHVATAALSVTLLFLAASDAAWSLMSQGGQLYPLPADVFAIGAGTALCLKWRADVRDDRRYKGESVTVHAIPLETAERDFDTLMRMYLDHPGD